MRILLLHQYFLEKDDGGGSRFNEMTRQWTDAGHEVTVLAGMMHPNGHEKRPEYKGRYFLTKQHEKVRVIRCHVSESYNTNFLGRLWGYFSFVFSSSYAGLFRAKGDFDVILATSPPLFIGITAYLLSLLRGLPIVFEVRDLWPESAIDTGVLKNKFIIRMAYWFEAFIYRKASLINVLTPAFQRKLVDVKKVPAEKVVFIPNAADFSISDKIIAEDFDQEAFREKLGITDKVAILYVGAHGVANHLIQVIDTAEKVKKSHPQLQFLFVGDGMEKPKLVAEAKARGLTNVTFFGSVAKTEVFRYILAADFGSSVLKKVDAFKTIYSNKTFDYMACRKPIFMVIDGISRELVEVAGCGIYVEPESPEDYIAKINIMLEKSPSELAEMGASGYQYAKQHFDRTILAEKYINHIARAVGKAIV